MPVPLRAPHHRAEAKFNVTTEFPSLGLHSAASTGNVGLVEYALSRGQPVNSVVDGVLPLHAACAGGNVQVVKLLIEYGADVNAPRLPKRYSSRDSSAPIIGTTGSTPLHFAAANGNREAIMLLLLHGAHADRPDKHGVTPEALARQHGWIECADVLREWIINKDKDLRDREEFVAADDKDNGKRRHRMGSFGDPEPFQTPRRRLHVKQSIDTALNMLRSSSSNLTDAYHRGTHTPTPPTSPTRPFGDYSSVLGNSNSDLFPDTSTRRPSLPHVMQSDSLPRPRKGSAQLTSSRRPSSAGEGAEENGPSTNSSSKTARRLGSKVSLLNIFRKGQPSEDHANTNLLVSDTPSLSTSPPTVSGSSLAQHRTRPHQDSDASIRSRKVAEPSLEQKGFLYSPTNSPTPLAADLYNSPSQEQQRTNNRDRSRSSASGSSRYDHLIDEPAASSAGSYHSPSSSPLARLGLLRGQSHHRTRSGSGSSLGYEVNVPSRLGMTSTATVDDSLANNRTGNTGADADNLSKSLPRSGIFRPHNRNGSNGQSHMTPSALRALRPQNCDTISHSPSPRDSAIRLKSSNSVGSLTRSESYSRRRQDVRPGSAGSMTESKQEDIDDDGDAFIKEVEEDQEEYGKPIEATGASLLIGIGKAPSSGGSLSPIISNDHASGETEDALMADFPFSINYPPPIPTESDMDQTDSPEIPIITRKSMAMDNRHRGDSLSSIETSGSQDYSQTSSTASTMMVATPFMSTEVAPPSDDKQEAVVGTGAEVDANEHDQRSQYVVISPAPNVTSFSPPPPVSPRSQGPHRPPPLPLGFNSSHNHMHTHSTSRLVPPPSTFHSTRSLSGRRTHTPFGIDITSISTHAQAEALVEKAKQEVLELVSQDDQEDHETSTGNDGRTPLSARLAAYGESLALERRLRELEKGGGSAASGVTISTTFTNGERSATGTIASSTNLVSPVTNQYSGDGSAYTASLYSGKSTNGMRNAPSPRSVSSPRPRRPSTAEGLAPRDMNLSLSSEQSDQSNQSMRSASALGHRRTDASPYHQPVIPTLSVSDAEDNYTYQPSSPISRSRTPTGDRENDIKVGLSISRMASLDGMAYIDQDFGSALYRVSTTPSPVSRLPPAQAQGRSAKKLSKMGISVADQVGIGVLPPPAPIHTGKRFGAFRSLFKGKT